MSVFLIIMGILMILSGCVFLCTPLATTFGLMYFYMILLFVAGIMILVRCIATKKFGVDFVFSILTIIAGVFVLFSPNLTFATEALLLYIVAAWLIVRGILGMIAAIRSRRVIGGGLCALGIIVSIMFILMGIYSLVHPLYFAEFLGILASVYFIIEGVDLIVMGATCRRL